MVTLDYVPRKQPEEELKRLILYWKAYCRAAKTREEKNEIEKNGKQIQGGALASWPLCMKIYLFTLLGPLCASSVETICLRTVSCKRPRERIYLLNSSCLLCIIG